MTIPQWLQEDLEKRLGQSQNPVVTQFWVCTFCGANWLKGTRPKESPDDKIAELVKAEKEDDCLACQSVKNVMPPIFAWIKQVVLFQQDLQKHGTFDEDQPEPAETIEQAEP